MNPRLLISFLLLLSLQGWGQDLNKKTHSIDSCSIGWCCKKFHRSFSVDTMTNEKIIVLSRHRGLRYRHEHTHDGCGVIITKSFQYYSSGNIHKKYISRSRGCLPGIPKGRVNVVIYSEKGKVISRLNQRSSKSFSQ
jgi:hypothetical protein